MSLKLKPLDQQVIVITGASSGIGLVTARRAAARGAKVVLVARSGDALDAAVTTITAAGGTATAFVADVGELGQVQAAAAHALARFGRIDTWVNDAGVAIYAKLLDTPEGEHRQMFQTNYFGAVHGANVAVPHLSRQGGALITVGSIAGDLPSPVMGAYAASKHAVKGFVESLRIELQTTAPNVSVTLVKPAGIDTPIGEHAANHQGGEALIPPPVYAPELVADTILDAAVHPRREITVGGAGRAQVLFAQHFPGLFEKLAPAMSKALTDPAKRQPTPDNLFAGANAGRERSHDQEGRGFSLYTTAARHPKTVTALSVGALIGGATLLLFNGRKK